MNSGEHNDIVARFFGEYSLYQKIFIPEELADHCELDNRGFNAFCPKDKKIQTFTTRISPEIVRDYWGGQPAALPTGMQKDYTIINFVQHYQATCNYCKEQKIDIIIHVYSDQKSETGITACKIGQDPPIEITPEKDIFNYLSDEDKKNYKKALINLSQSYGIGAYAYFRRIIENEIKRIIQDLIDSKIDGYEEIAKANLKFIQDHQMKPLIDLVGDYLPPSFKLVGDNPLSLLYSQLSGGIHEFDDEICLGKAKNIDIILRFLIRRMNEEKSEIKDVRKAMQDLRKNTPLI